MQALLRAGLVMACLFLFSEPSRAQVFDNQCPSTQSSMVPMRTVNLANGHFNDTVCADSNGNLIFQTLSASLSASDTFTRANATTLGPNWSTPSGAGVFGITTNAAKNISGTGVAFWNDPRFVSTAQFSQVTISIQGADNVGPAVMISSGAGNEYTCFQGTGATTLTLSRRLGGGGTTLASGATTGASGDVLRLEIDSSGNLTCYKNGVSTLTATDTTYKIGSPGIFDVGTLSSITNWSGGNLPVSQGNGPTISSIAAVLTATAFAGSDIMAQATNAFSQCAFNCTVYIPTGVYNASTTLTIPVYGNGRLGLEFANGATINYTGTGDAIVTTGSPVGRVNLKIEGGGQIVGTGSGVSGLHLRPFAGATVKDLTVRGFTNGDGFFNEGVNTVDFLTCHSVSNKNGVHNVGVVAYGSNWAPNAIHWYGGHIDFNTTWGWYEDSALSGTVGPNQGNGTLNTVYEVNGTGATGGQIFVQHCYSCEFDHNYIEQSNGTSTNAIVIGDGTHQPIGTRIKDNLLADPGITNIITNTNGLSTFIEHNVEISNPTNFIVQGASSPVLFLGLNVCPSCTNFLSGTTSTILQPIEYGTNSFTNGAPEISWLSSAAGTAFQFNLGRTATDAEVVIPGSGGTYFTDAAAGDLLLGAISSSSNVRLGFLGAASSLRVSNTGISALLYNSVTNCAVNSVSPAACGAAPSGVFAVPTTTTTYTVNTTAVTANSRIFIQDITDNTGIPSAPTCTALAAFGDGQVTSRVAATSFTIALPSTAGTTCFNYWIIN